MKAKRLSVDAGLGETAVRDIFEKANDVKLGTLVKLAEVLDTAVDELIGLHDVPLLGKVGVGGMVAFDEGPDPEKVRRPPLAHGQKLMALEVLGDSMYPKYEGGDVVYAKHDHEGVFLEDLGDHCVVRLVNGGGTFLKILTVGTTPGLYTLRSHNGADMIDVEVEWASPILWVMPRRSRDGKH